MTNSIEAQISLKLIGISALSALKIISLWLYGLYYNSLSATLVNNHLTVVNFLRKSKQTKQE